MGKTDRVPFAVFKNIHIRFLHQEQGVTSVAFSNRNAKSSANAFSESDLVELEEAVKQARISLKKKRLRNAAPA